MRRCQAVLVALVCPIALAILLRPTPARAAPDAAGLEYRPPVDGPVVDPFRAPLEPWGAGNRGVDLAALPGEQVHAAAPGEVVFAGAVGGDLHVVVLHADGLRTSYSFLSSVDVRRGAQLAGGDVVGTAAGPVHFGVRDGDRYIDPLALLAGRARVQLLPDRPAAPEPEQVERSRLVRFLRSLPHRQVHHQASAIVSDLPAAAPEAWRGWVHYGTELATPLSLRAAAALADWDAQRARCTPPDREPPPAPTRRMVVLVGGLGSTSAWAAVHAVDTTSLGYADDDVVVFSYRGATTVDRPYSSADTGLDLRLTGSRLAELVAALASRHPGVPVDVVAHSQGGVAARIALLGGAPVATIATLGSPHQGADLATAAAMASAAGVSRAATSVLQMAETSTLTRELARRGVPPDVPFLSVAARGDLVVPPLRSRLPGAGNVTVTLPPPYVTVHRRLPSSPQATRELRLALAGLPPTCRGLADVVADHLVGTATSLAEDSLGAALGLLATAR